MTERIEHAVLTAVLLTIALGTLIFIGGGGH